MNLFMNMKIRMKLISCFIVVTIFTAVVGGIGISNMNNINHRVDEMYTHVVLPSVALGKIEKNLQLIRVNYYLMLFEQDPATFQKRMDEIDKWTQEDNDILKGFVETIDSEEKRSLYNDVVDRLATYRNIRTQVLSLIKDEKYEEAGAMTAEFAMSRAAVDKVLENLIALEVQSAEDKAKQNLEDFKRQSSIMIMIIAASVLLSIGLGLLIANMISKPLHNLLGGANQIADGNLDVTIDIQSKDEVGILANAFRRMTDNLNDVMSNISTASEQVSSGSKQVSDSSMALSHGATEQASSIEQLTASIEEIASQTRLNAQNASQASELAESSKTNAAQGNEQMKYMLKAMDEINEASSNISKIIKVIDEIAFQTNILALNAAVEAARAGQHGKGFAVVAEEVRNLAARSANAAKETTAMIEGSIKKVEGGTKIAKETAEALNKIVEGISRAANLVNDIAIASNEQASGISQINQGIAQVSEVVQTNSATSEETAAASEELSGQAELLREQVSRFKLRRVSRNYSYKKADEIDPEVLRMLDTMSERKNESGYYGDEFGTEGLDADQKVKIHLSDRDFGKY